MMERKWIIGLCVLLIAIFVAFWRKSTRLIFLPEERELDWMSYIGSIALKIFIPQPFPKNTTEDIIATRKYFLEGAVSLESYLFAKSPTLKDIPFQELLIPVNDGNERIPLRLYNYFIVNPLNPISLPKKRVLLYFHGGGFVVGSMKESHGVILQIANITDYLVVSADYRLAPEHIFPTALNDAYETLQWVIHNIDRYGGDDRDIIVSGESAGGNLAAAVSAKYLTATIERLCGIKAFSEEGEVCASILAAEEAKVRWHSLSGAWLMYPVLAPKTPSPENPILAYESGSLSYQGLEWFRRLYQGSDDFDETIRNNHLFSPLRTPVPILSLFPPTIFTIAKHDILMPEAIDFAERLTDLHRNVTVMMFNSTTHGFVTFHPSLAGEAIHQAASRMRMISP